MAMATVLLKMMAMMVMMMWQQRWARNQPKQTVGLQLQHCATMTMHPAMPTSNSMQNSISRQRTHATHLLDRRTRSIIATPVADTSVIPSKLGKAPASAVSVESECYNSNICVASVSTYGKKSEPGGKRGGVGGSEALKMDAWAVSESVLAFCCCIGCGFLCFSRFSMSLALAVK